MSPRTVAELFVTILGALTLLAKAQDITECMMDQSPRSPFVYVYKGPMSICPFSDAGRDAIVCFDRAQNPDLVFREIMQGRTVDLCFINEQTVCPNDTEYVTVLVDLSEAEEPGRVVIGRMLGISETVNVFFSPSLSPQNPLSISPEQNIELVLGSSGTVIAERVFDSSGRLFLTVCEVVNEDVVPIGLLAQFSQNSEEVCSVDEGFQQEAVARRLMLIPRSLRGSEDVPYVSPERDAILFLVNGAECIVEDAVSNNFTVSIVNMSSTTEAPTTLTTDSTAAPDGMTIGLAVGLPVAAALIILAVVLLVVLLLIVCQRSKRGDNPISEREIDDIEQGASSHISLSDIKEYDNPLKLERTGTGESRKTEASVSIDGGPRESGININGSLCSDSGVGSNTSNTPNKHNSICVVCDKPQDPWYKDVINDLCHLLSVNIVPFPTIKKGNDYSMEESISRTLSNTDHVILIGRSTEGQTTETLYSKVRSCLTAFPYSGGSKIFDVRLVDEGLKTSPGLLCFPTKNRPTSRELAKCIYDQLVPKTVPTSRKQLSGVPSHVNELKADSTSELKEYFDTKFDTMTNVITSGIKSGAEQRQAGMEATHKVLENGFKTVEAAVHQASNQTEYQISELRKDNKANHEEQMAATQNGTSQIMETLVEAAVQPDTALPTEDEPTET